MAFAVIESGGTQYKVAPNQKIRVEKLENKAGESVGFQHVLLRADNGKVEVGMPHVKGATVEGKVLQQARDDKKIVFRYHSKTRQRKFKTHRQPFTEVELTKI